MIKVAIVDDHQIVIDGLESILQDHSDEIKVVDTFNNGSDLLNRIRRNGLDLAILDISMPNGMDGLETLKAIKADYPETKVLMLTMHKDTTKIKTALQHGADGYLLKNHSGKELVNAIKKINNGEQYYSQDVRDTFFEAQRSKAISDKQPLQPIKITPKEAEVLALLADDMPTKLIAEELKISDKTVEAHKKNLKEKIGAHTEKGLVRFAVENGYIL